jgi:hypothetical protein
MSDNESGRDSGAESDSDSSEFSMPGLVSRASGCSSDSDTSDSSGIESESESESGGSGVPSLLTPNADTSDSDSSESSSSRGKRAKRGKRRPGGARGRRNNDSVESDDDSVPPLKGNGDSDSDDDDSANIPELLTNKADSSDDSSFSNGSSSKSVEKETVNHFSDSEDSDIDDVPTLKKNVRDIGDDSDDEKVPQAPDLTIAGEKKRYGRMRAARRRREAEIRKKRNEASSLIAAYYRSFDVRKTIKKAGERFSLLQAVARGIMERRRRAKEVLHIHQYRKFQGIWTVCLGLMGDITMDESDWASLKDKQAYIRREDYTEDDEMKETDEKLNIAMADAMQGIDDTTMNEDAEFEVKEVIRGHSNGSSNTNGQLNPVPVLKHIHLSGDVVKWLRQGDRKYRDFFIRRMKQLATGENSRILQKRLFGSENTIYETYLEQKSGYRILVSLVASSSSLCEFCRLLYLTIPSSIKNVQWTEKDDYLLVWYVAKHKSVSRLMKLIDDSKNRSERQRISITEIEELKHVGCVADEEKKKGHEIFLDPLGNVPLKVYNIDTDDIEDIAKENWTPGLYLTDEERDVVETRGTVLLLGRSGTGKEVP